MCRYAGFLVCRVRAQEMPHHLSIIWWNLQESIQHYLLVIIISIRSAVALRIACMFLQCMSTYGYSTGIFSSRFATNLAWPITCRCGCVEGHHCWYIICCVCRMMRNGVYSNTAVCTFWWKIAQFTCRQLACKLAAAGHDNARSRHMFTHILCLCV